MRRGSKYELWVAAGLLIFGSPAVWANEAPEVTNVTAGQRTDGSMLVDLGYDLADGDGDPCIVSVVVSDDGGSTWDVPATSFTGDVGAGITPGVGKAIVWDSGADLPGAYGTNYKVRVCADDGPGGEMVFVPGGEFQMGDHHDGMPYALPVHAVYVDSFYMDVYEVTNEQYCAYLNDAYPSQIKVDGGVVYDTGDSGNNYPYCDTYEHDNDSRIHFSGGTFTITAGKEDHPMVQVSWYGAVAYANWRSAQDGRTPCYNLSTWECNFAVNGYRLPTEAEWEKAARGGLYSPYRRYSWGDTLDGSKANYWDSGDPYETGDWPLTTPVGYYDGGQTPPGVDMANGYGLYDMTGNIWEWCNDWFDADYYETSPYSNPPGPAGGTFRVARGGSWYFASSLRCASRGAPYPEFSSNDVGFRLLLD